MKIVRFDDIKNKEVPSAVALGFFDGLHKGHAAVIGAAKASGLRTVVATFERHPSEILKDRSVKTIMSAGLKEHVFEELGVDMLCYLDFEKVRELSAEEFLQNCVIAGLGARQVFCGFNYRFGRGGHAGPEELRAICAENGAEGFFVPPVCVGGEPVSSTRIRALIEQGRVQEASKMLGRPVELYFEVISGRKLGRKLGAPTINQRIPASHVMPRFGVYASVTHAGGGEALPSVTNVGVKPTVGSSFVSAETYILGYKGDLYGKTVAVDLIDFLRPEMKFAGLGELKAQIGMDAAAAGEITALYLAEKC